MNNIKLFAKNEKELETLIQTIEPGYRNGIWHRKMCHVDNEKWKKRKNRRNRTVKSRKNQNVWGKGKLQMLVNIGMDAIR